MTVGPPRRLRTARQLLRLLKNAEFRKEGLDILKKMAQLRATDPSTQEWEAAAEELVSPFISRWGVPPPHAGALLDPDPRRPIVGTIAAGRWSVVPIFPWTTDAEIRHAVSRIRRAIGKQHRDAENERRAQLCRWLEACGVPSSEIARTVWGRRDGLARPSRSEAIRHIPEVRERELLEEYLRQGLSRDAAEQRVYRRLRGSEAKAVAAMRAAKARYVRATERLNVDLETPLHADPRGYALTMLMRAVADENSELVLRWAREVKQAFLTLPET